MRPAPRTWSTTSAWAASSAPSPARSARCSTTPTRPRPTSATCARAIPPARMPVPPRPSPSWRVRRRTGSETSRRSGRHAFSRERWRDATAASRHRGRDGRPNTIRTIREEDGGASEITLVSAERPYSRMVLPYYLGASIAESHVYTATPASLAAWKVKTMLGRRAKSLDTVSRTLTLDDGATVEYDNCVIATGSRAVRPPVEGAELPGVHSFWTLDEARAVIAAVQPGTRVVMVGAGFIAFTILNAILARGASLTIVEVAPR